LQQVKVGEMASQGGDFYATLNITIRYVVAILGDPRRAFIVLKYFVGEDHEQVVEWRVNRHL
jgi:hypothetical protein